MSWANPRLGRRAAGVGAILLVAMLLMWPALVNGGPFYHPDTPSYFRGAASALFKLFGLKTAWVDEYLRVYAPHGGPPAAHASASGAGTAPVTLSGRSIYYGTFLYLAYLAGSVWIAVAVQSLLTAVSIFLTVRTMVRAMGREVSARAQLVIGLVAALLTPVGYFTANLMPDLSSGIGLLAIANLLFLWPWMPARERVFWWCALAFAALAHSTNPILFAALVVFAVAYGWKHKAQFSLGHLSSIIVCIVIGLLGQLLFSQSVKHSTGYAPVRPPFVAMRLIADGPGYTYLREHCPTEPFLYCRVIGRPDRQSDTLLWSKDRNASLFRGLTPPEQRLSASQQKAFVADVVAERPFEVFASGARNSLVQLLSVDLNSFNYTADNKARYEETIPSVLLRPLSTTRAYRNAMPVRFVAAASAVLAALSLLLFVAVLTRNRTSRTIRGYILTIIAAIAINAAICGALSGPKGRYEMRLLWVLPVIAGALAFNWRRSASSAPDTP